MIGFIWEVDEDAMKQDKEEWLRMPIAQRLAFYRNLQAMIGDEAALALDLDLTTPPPAIN